MGFEDIANKTKEEARKLDREDYDNLGNRVAMLSKAVISMDKKVEELSDEVERLKRENNDLKDEIAELKSEDDDEDDGEISWDELGDDAD